MKIEQTLDDFDPAIMVDNRTFATGNDGIFEYNFETNKFDYKTKTLPETAFVSYKTNYRVMQNIWNLADGKSSNNKISILKFLKDDSVINYTYNILLTGLSINQDYLLSTYTTSDQKFFTPFNPFTKEKKWELGFDINKDVRILECNENFFVLLVNKTQLLCHSSQTGEALWSFHISDYLMKDIPLFDDGTPVYTPKLETTKYNPTNQTLLVHLYPDKLLAIDAKNGSLVWVKDIPVTIQWHLDSDTGNIYIMETASFMETYIEDDGRTREVRRHTCIYHHIEGSTGNTLLQRDLKEVIPPKHEDGTARALNFHHFGGCKDDSLYLSLFGEGELYKINKHTGALEESYIHDRNFESEPIIHQNRLFLTDPMADDETRLLVFEI